MQIYVGTSGLKKILGVTKQSQDQWNPQASDSIFHSSLPYLQLEEFKLTNWSWLTLGPAETYSDLRGTWNAYGVTKVYRNSEIANGNNTFYVDGKIGNVNSSLLWGSYRFPYRSYRFQKFVLPDYAKALIRQRTPYFLVYKWSNGFNETVQPSQPSITLEGTRIYNRGYANEAATTKQDLMNTGLDELSQQLNLTSSQEYLLVPDKEPQYDLGAQGNTVTKTVTSSYVQEVTLYFTKNLSVVNRSFQFSSLNPEETQDIKISNSEFSVGGMNLLNNSYLQVHSQDQTFTDTSRVNDIQQSNIFQGGVTQNQGSWQAHHQYYGKTWYYGTFAGYSFDSGERLVNYCVTPKAGMVAVDVRNPLEVLASPILQPFSYLNSRGNPPIGVGSKNRIIFPGQHVGGNYLYLGVHFDSGTDNITLRKGFLTDRKYTELSQDQTIPLIYVLRGSTRTGVTLSSQPPTQGISVGGKQLFSESVKMFSRVGKTQKIVVPRGRWGKDYDQGGSRDKVQYSRNNSIVLYTFTIEDISDYFLISIQPQEQQDYNLVDTYPLFASPQSFTFVWNWWGSSSAYSGYFKSAYMDSEVGATTLLPLATASQASEIDNRQAGLSVSGQGYRLGLIKLGVGMSYFLSHNQTPSTSVAYNSNPPQREEFYLRGHAQAMLLLERTGPTTFQVVLRDTYYPDNPIRRQPSYPEGGPVIGALPQYNENTFSLMFQPLL